MRALLQRVSKARVTVDDKLVSEIKYGLLVFICAMAGDNKLYAQKMASKISKIRIFNDEDGRMNKSIVDIDGEALIVSQFTLAADISRGNRPGFSEAAAPDNAEKLYDFFTEEVKSYGIVCKKGVFGGEMKVDLINDGPATIWIDNGNPNGVDT